MSFVLKIVGMTFQRMMDHIFAIPFIFIYLDYMLVARKNREEHCCNLHQVLTPLQANGLCLNDTKCVWTDPEVEFLIQRIAGGSTSPLPEHVRVIQSFPQLVTGKDLHALLGLFTFHHWFMARVADDHLASHCRSERCSTKLDWSVDTATAFPAGQTSSGRCLPIGPFVSSGGALPGHRCVLPPCWQCPATVALLNMEITWVLFSKTHSAQLCNSTFDWELLAAFQAINSGSCWKAAIFSDQYTPITSRWWAD
jgi:hypothetical protein